MIYLDNAATSQKKPEAVYEAVNRALRECSGNPGRSGHQLSLSAGKLVYETRLLLSRLFHAEKAEQIIFTFNATDGLNTAIYGTAGPGSHVITSSMEHNSVARPLHYLETLGTEVTKLRTSLDYGVDPDDVKAAIKKNTDLVVMSHISNVSGTVNPIEEIGKICREAGVPFLVDASQSAGARPIDVQAMNIDMLACPGHKSLLGPQGTGVLYLREGVELRPFRRGGTGSRSELPDQPEIMPDKYESGTLNVAGIAGLGAGVREILETGTERIMKKEKSDAEFLRESLLKIPELNVIAPGKGCDRGSVLSFTLEGTDAQDIAYTLDAAFEIAVRSGLHCAPDAHRSFGTLECGGAVRVSPGYYTTREELETFLKVLVGSCDDM